MQRPSRVSAFLFSFSLRGATGTFESKSIGPNARHKHFMSGYLVRHALDSFPESSKGLDYLSPKTGGSSGERSLKISFLLERPLECLVELSPEGVIH